MASRDDEDGPRPGADVAPRRRNRRGLLKLYYGVSDDDRTAHSHPTDIDGPHFKVETYLDELYKTAGLEELMEHETKMVREIKALDSDMQTLVYENYNKFISATDTIRKMKDDFRQMEDEMESLAENMQRITDFSDTINATLADKRHKIKKLSGVHGMLKKLQFLFELPARLNKCMEMGSYAQAVKYYCKASGVLQQYQDMPSFRGIQEDCEKIVDQLRVKLREMLADDKATSQELSDCVDLLLQLDEPAGELCDQFLTRSKLKLEPDLNSLIQSCDAGDSASSHEDIVEYIDRGCKVFLSNLSLFITSFQDLFVRRDDHGSSVANVARPRIQAFVSSLMGPYFDAVRSRCVLESQSGEGALLVKALDKLHRRIQAVQKLMPSLDIARVCADIILAAAEERVNFCSEHLRSHLSGCIMDVQQALASRQRQLTARSGPSNIFLSDLLSIMETSITDKIKATLTSLKDFVAPEITFANKHYFRSAFCLDWVSQRLILGFIRHVLVTAEAYCEQIAGRDSVPPALVLIVSRWCLDFEQSTISYLMTLTDEMFPLMERGSSTTKPIATLCSTANQAARKLINHYVQLQGVSVSQMIRKSVETRDWIATIEPRSVRAVMKRVVEDLTLVDLQVGMLYEEGVRKDRSSDDSRRTYSQSRQMGKPWGYTPSMDSSLLSNIQKLFSERIEIFSNVEFTRVSVVTGIVKIALKTLLECVRLKTFGKYGLQQMQVDCHYLQLYLWRFVSDENLVHGLLDEVMNSAVNRCIEPHLMEPSVVEVICNQV